MKALQHFDVFPKFDQRFEQEAREKTVTGAAMSLAAFLIIVYLIIGELRYFQRVETRHELYVDGTDIGRKLNIRINVTFPLVPCDFISIDALDSFGEFQEHIEQSTRKRRVHLNGDILEPVGELYHSGQPDGKIRADVAHGDVNKECGSCYGAERRPGQCCNTCDEVQAVYRDRGWSFDMNDAAISQCAGERIAQSARLASKEGCNIAGTLSVRRVQGNMHFIPGRTVTHLGRHLHDLAGLNLKGLDLTHRIHQLSFGEGFPGLVNPLDNRLGAAVVEGNSVRSHSPTEDGGGHVPDRETVGGGKFQYFIKVVPTRFERLSGETLETNQYSVTEHFSPPRMQDQGFVPGVFMVYDLSPILVHIFETKAYDSLAHLILELCAIIGGVFTVAGIVDSFLYHGTKQVRRKMAMGKFS